MADRQEVVFGLDETQFSPHERVIAAAGAIRVSSFRYPGGVAALRMTNAVGEIIVLPFHGQQIWDATFYGRRLTMRSVFTEPVISNAYLENYGAFLVHCGASAMGNPAPDDTHPLHGELPNARMQEAELRFGADERGEYVRLSGLREERVAFSTNYDFRPMLTLRPNSGRIGLELSVQNHRSRPMELMYLAHVNFRPIDGARMVDALPDTPEHFRVRTHLPNLAAAAPEFQQLVRDIVAEPSLHRDIVAGRRIDPELVAGIDCVAGPDGWSHALQVLPDGSADFISHRPAELKNGIRWMTRNGDEDALGMVLPSTTEVDGREAERRKGNVRPLESGAEWRASLEFGALDVAETRAMVGVVEGTRG